MKYYYLKQDLFSSSWVECTEMEYFVHTNNGIYTCKEPEQHEVVVDDDEEYDPLGEQPRDRELLEAIKDFLSDEPDSFEEYVDSLSDTPLKDALLDELRDSTPAIVSILADELIEEEDLHAVLTPTPEQMEYFIDEELVNPDYDELEFEEGEEETSDDVIAPNVGDSSTNINRWFPHAAITMSPQLKSEADNIKKVAAAIYTLMEGGMQYDSDELDGTKFVKRLETYRDVTTNTNKKTRANPSILFLPDFSPSCSSYASLYNTFLEGVTTIRDDFNVISAPHFNGLPKWFVINGKKSTQEMKMWENDRLRVDSDGDLMGTVSSKDAAQDFYFAQMLKMLVDYNITTVIIAGDMDGTWMFKRLLLCEQVERVIWVDGSYWESEGKPTDKTGELCYRLFTKNAERKLAKSKLSYWSGVKTVKEFVRVFERSNSW